MPHTPTAGGIDRSGLVAVLTACLLWGLFPFYFKALGATHPLEATAHRMVWALPFLALTLTFSRAWGEVRRALLTPRVLRGLVVSGLLISVNWTFYAVAVFHGRVLDASLGYFLSPLLSVLFGVVVLGERLSGVQTFAVVLAGLAVLNLVLVVGVVPVMALALATSFALYGLVRKRLPVGPQPGLAIECVVVLPLSLAFLAYVANAGGGIAFGSNLPLSLLLMLGGPLTVLPLLCFNLGAKRLPLATVGLALYLIPTLLFLEGVFVFGEPAGTAKLVTFAGIWAALALYTYDGYRRRA